MVADKLGKENLPSPLMQFFRWNSKTFLLFLEVGILFRARISLVSLRKAESEHKNVDFVIQSLINGLHH